MTSEFSVRGVPASLKQDGWWLVGDSPEAEPNTTYKPHSQSGWTAHAGKIRPTLLALVILVALADWLFWTYAPGLSLPLFSGALFLAALWIRRPRRTQNGAALILVLTSLPAIEHFQALSLAFQLLGLISAVAWLHLPDGALFPAVPKAALHLLRALPLSGLQSLIASLRQQGPRKPTTSTLKHHMRNWAFPTGGALILVTLLLEANPVLEHQLADLFDFDLDLAALLRRALFWCGTALLIWPFLIEPAPLPSKSTATDQAPGRRKLTLGLNPGSVLRALLVFNLILLAQSAMDLSILFAGAELPKGMTLASYAHRGAYPLLATAMLAGAFALAARPYLNSHSSLKPLMMLWLGQNALLGLTSLLRLDLYVESFGLTYLRTYAMIWIGLVVAGLLLTAWQILKARSNPWLLQRCAALGLGTLYLCSFVNFASLIAHQNLSMTSKHAPDWPYLCSLGPLAASGIKEAQLAKPYPTVPQDFTSCWQIAQDQRNWREWGFRTWRVTSYAGNDLDNTSAADKAP